MSAASVYFHNSLATVSYHASGYVCLTWSNAAIAEDELRALYTHTLHALTHYRSSKLLTDQRARQPLPVEAQQWIVREWIPAAVRASGYSHCAIVEGVLPETSAPARNVGNALQTSLSFRYFTDPEPAGAWLAEQNGVSPEKLTQHS
ncbi:hypothetical protein [Hymenobacter sp. CRA2]|uniref:hypothetical protein n=1 Tax=Hymenobacter sp. CRA2 TaxID=1955620 RepID=UPI00098EBAD4|nr:hypothetical protein [Hymenobacter sp. CRA2]OON69709.1 hypothetical protein B0919_07200 [Hymenobacter sp. CRA2]